MAATDREAVACLIAPDAPALVVAGASADERRPATRATPSPMWFQPEHVRDHEAATARLQAAAQAGADVVVAPAYRTHRRALMAVGETRRAGEWTRAAVEVARVAVERAAEEAAAGIRATPGPEVGAGDAFDAAPPPAPSNALAPALIAGPMGPLEDGPWQGRSDGASDPGATADEDHERADLLADAGVELLLIEGMRSVAAARSALEAAIGTGLPVWLGLSIAESGHHLPSGDPLEQAWQELAPLAPHVLVVSPGSLAQTREVLDHTARFVEPPLGLWLTGDGAVTTALVAQWLESGARAVGFATSAGSGWIDVVRRCVDETAAASAHRRSESDAAWHTAVRDGARRAPGGRAAWLGPGFGAAPGFDWVAAPMEEAARLPRAAFRLVVADAAGGEAPPSLTHLLDEGGYLVLRSVHPPSAVPAGASLSIQRSEALPGGWLTLLRRDE